jgi:Kdo2-lipid IVA lauroyltransferase/acyltransferase
MPEAKSKKKPRRSAALRQVMNRLEGIGATIMFGVFRLLPLDTASALGGWLARLVGPCLGVSKRARINLQRALPQLGDDAARRVIRAMWDNLGRVIAEYPHLDKFAIDKPGGRLEVVGWENVETMLKAGKSGIFISAHFANWEVATMALTQRGLAVAEIYRATNNPFVDRLIAGFRGHVGSELVPKGVIAARRSIAALREGRHLAMLVDQKMNDGIAVPFFGRDAMTAPAAAQLATRFDGAVMPVRVERLRGAHFRIHMLPPVEIAHSGNRHDDARAAMSKINREIEGWIRRQPEMWLWLHRRWPD